MLHAPAAIRREQVRCLTAAMAGGQVCSADALRRALGRCPAATNHQRELLASAEALEALRARLAGALNEFERRGAVAVASLCRELTDDPMATFAPLQRWGVCAVSGRTVNRLLLVRAGGNETTVDVKFGSFLRSVWCVGHWEVVEAGRFDGAGDPVVPEVGLAALCALYERVCEEVTATLALTAAALARPAGAQE
jgi:hypothetical protein